jgi:hypothetical protein
MYIVIVIKIPVPILPENSMTGFLNCSFVTINVSENICPKIYVRRRTPKRNMRADNFIVSMAVLEMELFRCPLFSSTPKSFFSRYIRASQRGTQLLFENRSEPFTKFTQLELTTTYLRVLISNAEFVSTRFEESFF